MQFFLKNNINKAKINPILYNNVSILKKNEIGNVLISSFNFEKTIKVFEKFNLKYSPYPFANCFCVEVKLNDLAKLSQEKSIKYIDPCVKVFAEQKQQDSTRLLNLTEDAFKGQGQTICFIDTGIFPHFDFVFPFNRIVKFVDFVNRNTTPYDDNGHGTFVAGIASGSGCLNLNNIGFAPKANIIALKALGENGSSDSNLILDAMQWVYENHKQYKISVVCMSFGADIINSNDPLSRGAEALWKCGITVVAAAGNSGPERETIKSPGNNPHIITVGGYDENKNEIADFSSRGPTIFGFKPDLVAPAVDVIACSNTLTPYTTMSGTSVSTPIVAGICADLKSKFPNIKNTQIKQFLMNNCQRLTGDRNVEGSGLLQF